MIQILYTGGTIGMVPSSQGLTPNLASFKQALTQHLGQPVLWHHLPRLIDSSQITPVHWRQILAAIDQNAEATIILHGTDTLAYTAAIVSFFAPADHPVVLTGAQLSWFEANSDAPANIDLAMQACQLSGCHIAFGGRILPARSSFKRHTEAVDGFYATTNANTEASTEASTDMTLPSGLLPDIRYRWITPTPGQHYGMVDALDVLILENLGSGQLPECQPLIDQLQQASVVLVTSQCPQGNVDLSRYAANAHLLPVNPIGCGHARREEIIAACYAAFAQSEHPPRAWLTHYFAMRSACKPEVC